MLIVGAKGFAKEVLEVLHRNKDLQKLVFFDDVNVDIGEKLSSIASEKILENGIEEAFIFLENNKLWQRHFTDTQRDRQKTM